MSSSEIQLRYKNAVLDWDGTLAKTLNIGVAAYIETFKLHDFFEFTEAEVIASMGSFRAKIHTYWGQSQEVADALVKETHQRMTPQLETAPFYEGAAELVRTLGFHGVRQAIVSKSHARTIKRAAQHNGIYALIDAFVGGNELPEAYQKPHRMPVDLALHRLGDEHGHDRTLIIGDSLTDLTTARNAGVDSVLFLPPENEPFYDFAELRKGEPTYEVTSLLDIVPIVVGEEGI